MSVAIASFICQNCGHCCGPIPLRDWELSRLKKTAQEMPQETREKLKHQHRHHLTCILRDEESRMCSVYNSRPSVCRIMGTTAGLPCPMNPSAPLSSREQGRTEMGGGKFVGVLGLDIGWSEREK
jgi:hypothetical protein